MGSRGGGDSVGDAGAALSASELLLLSRGRVLCTGCGSKVGSSVLARALSRAKAHLEGGPGTDRDAGGDPGEGGAAGSPGPGRAPGPPVPETPAGARFDVFGPGAPEDAAVVQVPEAAGGRIVQSVDFLRAPVGDMFALGRLAAVHSLSDVHAMGGRATTALAMCTVAEAGEALVEEDLFQMLCGAGEVLAAEGCALAGGHTTEGPEAVLGFSVTGYVDAGRDPLRKGPMRPGDALVLTKALGTGALLAAGMRGQALGRDVGAAVAQMQVSNRGASEAAVGFGASACTDVTGFGLLGHLAEMMDASPGVSVTLDAAAVPLLGGAADCVVRKGVLSSLHAANARVTALVQDFEDFAAAWPAWPLLVDPQTAGGLLFAVREADAGAAVAALRAQGLGSAAIIGRVDAGTGLRIEGFR